MKKLLALSLALLASGAAAQTATLVEDIAAQEVPFLFGGAHTLHPVGQSLFFIGYGDGTEPWASDGTAAGTRMLADSCPDPCYGNDPQVVGTLGNRLVYLRGQLWSTDGTPAGTEALTNIGLQIGDSQPLPGVRLGDRIYFKGCEYPDGSSGNIQCDVWSTDGTRAGTGKVPVLTPDPEIEIVSDLTAGATRVYFTAHHRYSSDPPELWAADAAGARKLFELPERYSILAAWGDRLFYTVREDEDLILWATDGTAAGTRAVGSFATLRAWLNTGPSGLYFVADDVVHGEEIWRTNGTPEGTVRVTEFGYFEPFFLFSFDDGQEGWAHEIDGRLLFGADDQLTGKRLWLSTGTPESTRAAGPAVLGSRIYRAGNRLFAFRFDEAGQDCEVWSFDSQGTGTRLVDRLPKESCGPGTYWDNIRMRAFGNRLYFAAQEGPATWGIWRTDGTAAGTARLFSVPSYVSDLAATPGESRVYAGTERGLWVWDAQGARQLTGVGLRSVSSFPRDLAAHQGKLFFTAVDGNPSPGDPERTIWTSQGSEADTAPFVGPAGACPYPGRLVSASSGLVFLCDGYVEDDEIRSALPGGGGSVLLADGVPRSLIPLEHQGRVWFLKNGEVWTTDGTPGGTTRLTDSGGSPVTAYHASVHPPVPWALSDGRFVYFVGGRPGDQTAQLWRSDGTPAGTIPLRTLFPSLGFEVARAGSTTLVRVSDKLYRTDGSALGTTLLTRPDGSDLLEFPHDLAAHGGFFYAYASTGPRGMTFWRTDGTPAGTAALLPGGWEWSWNGSEYGDDLPIPVPVSLGGKLFFVAGDPEHGTELWTTDGTPAGTALLADIAPGPLGSSPARFTVAGGALWFTAFDPVHGRELWRTDGTPAGTRMVQDIFPEGRSSSPGVLTAAGDRLYFSADDGITGRELWSLPLAGPGSCQPSATALCLQGGRYRVESRWRDFQGNGGTGKAVPLSGDTGTFWFFSPSNVEVLLKVLDGRGVNGHFWVFYGALSNVEYTLTVTDTQTGLARRYSNPAGQLASAGDTQGFGPKGAQSTVPDEFIASPSPPARVRGWSSAAATAPCVPGARRLCLNGGRFAVEVAWKDFQGTAGLGTAVPATSDTGYFWFFDQANIELAVKVLDGRGLNGKFWVFYGALSNVEYTVTVTDTQTGAVKQYKNPAGQFGSVGDTGAF